MRYYLVGLYPLHDGVSVNAVLVPVDPADRLAYPYFERRLDADDLRRIFSPLGGIRPVMEMFYPDGCFGMVVDFPNLGDKKGDLYEDRRY